MSDFDLDELLAGAVADYRDETAPLITPAGTGAAIATAGRRRRAQTAVASAIVAVLVIAPIVLYASTHHDRGSAPPAVAPTSRPSVNPSVLPSPSQDRFDLGESTLTLPGWGDDACPKGPTKFTNGQAGPYTYIDTEALGDVNHDGLTDTVAMIACRPGEIPLNQIVAFHKNSDDTVTTIGLVVTPVLDSTDPEAIARIIDVGTAAGGSVGATVGDYKTTYSDTSLGAGVSQERVYAWNGSAFEQVAGLTTFHVPASIHLAVSWSPIRFAKPHNGERLGTVTAVIRNNGSATVRHVSALLLPAAGQPVAGSTCAVVDSIAVRCDDVTIAPGRSVTITLHVRLGESEAAADIAAGGVDDSPTTLGSFAQVRVGEVGVEMKTGLGKVIFD